VLQPYLQADDPRSQETTLSDLMETHAQPIVRRVVLARLAGLWDDIDDVCSEVRLELLLRLRRVKTDPKANAIADFPAYVATVAVNACNQYFRRRRPGHARLKKQIRFLLSHEPQFRLESSPDSRAWCGLSERDRAELETPGKTGRSPNHIDDIVSGIDAHHDLGRLIAEILESAGGPLELDVVVDVVARIWRIPQDAHAASANVPVESVPSPFVEPELAIDRRRYTARLWEEIRQLPRSQRAALLLHLRDHAGNSVLFLFPLCGVASFEQIASALEVKQETLSDLWNRLPLDDFSIGSLLSCARQQVINLRMSARKRLANRMR
jgi:RNA polymerase sigma factor (sigma-70 family)